MSRSANQVQLAMRSTLCCLAVIGLATLAACGNSSSDTPQTAKGETPVRFLICDFGDRHCSVVARFNDLASCKTYDQFANMLCDRQSVQGQIICKENTGGTSVVSYCLR
jgi:hypothetical protein